jgi:hypothetical protein
MIYQTTEAVSPVSVEEAKTYMRVYHDIDDALIASMLQSATAEAEHRMQREVIKRNDPKALADTAENVPQSVIMFILSAVDTMYRFRGQQGEATLKDYLPHILDPYILYIRDDDSSYEEA